MPYSWLMRFHLSAAVALPSLSLLWLTLPANALEEFPISRTETVATAQPDQAAAGLSLPHVAQVVAAIEAQPAHVAFSHGTLTPPFQEPANVAQVTARDDAENLAPKHQATAPTAPLTPSRNTVSGVNNRADSPAIANVSTAPQAVEPTPYAVRFSQAAPAEATPAPASPDASDGDAEAADDTFSPLPATNGDAGEPGELEAPGTDEQPALEDPAGLDDTPGQLADPVPGATGEAVPIPAERVLDELQYLDPLPNPLLLPTQPEEVEIIGTQPLTLEEAIELSYRNNPDLRVAVLELEQSQAALREAQAALYPTVAVNGTLQGQNTTQGDSQLIQNPDGTISFESNTSEELGASLSAQLDVSYNLYSSGRREASIQAAAEQVQLSLLEVERRQEELRLATANEYYDLQASIEAIRISQAFLEEAERNLRDTRLREEVGVGTRFDVLRAEVQVANARQDLVNSERARLVAQRTLSRRLNVPPSLTITTVPVDIAGTWPLGLEESIILAYQNRAELEQQLIQRDINDLLERVELSALGPQVDLFANYRISDILTQEDSFNDSYAFGARVSWTLFDGGASQARARQRELEGEIAERNFEDARNAIRLNVESAFFNLQANLTNIDTARLAVQQAQEALDLAILRFDAGVGTQLDILNAQSELTDAEVNLVQAIVGYNRSLAELNRAVSNLPEPYYEPLPY